MNILHVITRSEWGGAQKIVFQLAREQTREGHNVVVMCGEKGRLVYELSKLNISVRLNPYLVRKPGLKDLLAGLTIWREIKNGYDIIHAHSSKAGALVRLVSVFSESPNCFTIHGFGVTSDHKKFKQKLYHTAEAFLSSKTDALVFLTQADKDYAKVHNWLTHAKYSLVIPNGIDIPLKEESVEGDIDTRTVRNKFGIPSDAFVIGNFARIAWVKNPEFWIKTAEKFLLNYPDSFFIWFGGGNELINIQSKLQNSVFHERIKFWGEVHDIEQAFSCIDVLFLSSRSEGMPLVILEGMSRKKAIAAPALPGLEEMLMTDNLEVEKCGLLYTPGNLEEAIMVLTKLRDRTYRTYLGESGYKKCSDVYSVNKMTENYFHLYKYILENHNKPLEKEE